MSDSDSGSSGGCGCGGCVMLIVFIFLVTAIGWGVPIGDKKWNIDIFPPRIWNMNKTEAPEKDEKPASAVETTKTTTDSSTSDNW